MTHISNTEQFRIWNGADGHHWADHHARYDTMASGYDEHLFEAAALSEHSRVLDIGCGTGQTTRTAARRAHRGHAVGLDLSEPMLARARQIAASEKLTNIGFEQGDAQVHPFTADRFDTVISRAGVMFFADPVAAFTNIATAMKPGGRIVFTCHREPGDTVSEIFAALAEYVPIPEFSDLDPGVTNFADPDQVRDVLTTAGFAAVTATGFECLTILGRDRRDATDFLFTAHLRSLVAGADTTALRKAKDAVEATLRPHETDLVRIPARGWLYSAERI
ncbi:class I SAM-dependent methyltransferase [Nocardia mexicana]|uniref:Ubiquinone/menaquinone biosynthesis C-methylase UbiE n=1 Tax=Nocardia mexicana TaxID=279262 RepID=A0A370GET5_9NOCA|nr:class I SAM-dependent methyltransferase [Nocardia mexicana]RDI41780.1 ubiquinone/menaquinone biosynthesis C-methylase UbiE [Nocardia mexicana]